jgi:TOMM system kinase/cyclase fusion protein
MGAFVANAPPWTTVDIAGLAVSDAPRPISPSSPSEVRESIHMQGQASIVAGATFEDRYEILAEIGSGGFGTVYQAKQLATGQLVAIKVLRWQDQAGPGWDRKLARFLREMRLCARLHHPNIVRLIDAGRSEEGAVYTAFEFVPGRNLGDILAEEGALDPIEARHLMLQVLDALATAHGQGIVHRDLKPKNIMVTLGARRNALVLDFGIGAITGPDDEETEDLTGTGEMLGSPGYAAPEQLLRGRPTPRSDLFSWALVFLECLTGVGAEPIHRLVLQRLDPQPVSIPPPLADHPLGDLLQRALVKDVSAREVTAEQLLRQLEACDVRDLPLSAMAHGGLDSSRPSSRRTSGVAPRLPDTEQRTSASGSGLLRRERRQVTAVCCKMDVPPHGTRPEDIEDADDQLDAIQRLIVEQARRFGGWVVGAAADAVVVCFGYPTARTDDATRAANAALAIDAALRQRRSERTPPAQVAIGIHTGLVMARDNSESHSALGPVVGTTLRVAMEIARTAAPGQVLASAETRRVTEALFDYQSEGVFGIDASGIKVDAFTLQATRASDLPTPASIRQTPLVGRERDLALVLEMAEKARRGVGQALFLHGEPGIGKSRLVREVIRDLQRNGFTVLEARCAPESANRALYPFIDLLERTLEITRNDGRAALSPGEKLQKVETLVRSYGFDVASAVPIFAVLLGIPLEAPYQPLDVSPAKLKEMTRDALLSLCLEMADAHPLVLLLEDLHWSDPTTREVLAKLTAESSASPVLVLMTARPEFVPSWSPSSVTSLALGRLTRTEAEKLVSKVTQGAPLPREVLDRVIERTDGVPLFVEELVSALVDSGEIVIRQGRYELTKPLSEINVPTTLRASLTARLDRLGRAKQTAQIAAVIGRDFGLDHLTALSSGTEGEVRADLEMLISADLVHGRRRRREATYSFKHALVRDAAYELLPKNARQQTHARLAGILETQFPEIAQRRPELLAKHHAAANQMEKAIGYAKSAAMGALQRSANAEVVTGIHEALSWVQGLDGAKERATAELELNGLLTMALMATYGFGAPVVAEAIARSQALLPLVGDGPLATGTQFARLMYHHIRAERTEARSLAEALVAGATERDDRDQLVAVLPSLGQCFYLEGNLSESRKQLERALSLYDEERHRHYAVVYGLDSKVYAHATLALVMWLLGHRDEAWEHGHAGIAWARELRHAPSEALALLFFSGLPHYEQDRAKVIEVTQSLLEVVERHGLFMYQAFCGVLRGWADGNTEGALRSLEGVRATGQEIAMSYYLSLVAECEAASGSYAGALSRIDEALSHAAKTGEMYYAADLERLRGEWLLQTSPPQHDAAEQSLLRAIELARERAQRATELRASLSLGRLLRSTNRAVEARTVVAAACRWHENPSDWSDLSAARSFIAENEN